MYVCFVIQLSKCMVFFDPHPLFGTGSDMMQAGAFVLLGRTNTFGCSGVSLFRCPSVYKSVSFIRLHDCNVQFLKVFHFVWRLV